jgi:hypothetical protein
MTRATWHFSRAFIALCVVFQRFSIFLRSATVPIVLFNLIFPSCFSVFHFRALSFFQEFSAPPIVLIFQLIFSRFPPFG